MNRFAFLEIGVAALAPAIPFMHAEAAATRLQAIERRTGGRLGVYARDLGDGRVVAHRAFERFPMCSTFKAIAVSAVLQRVDRGRERLDREIAFGKGDILEYAPVTKAHLRNGAMTVRELCAAAMIFSDNTAVDLLLGAIGGPRAVTDFVRSNPFEDTVTRLDRTEPTLNTALPGDPRDTTWPSRMARDLGVLLTSDTVLSKTSSQLLEGWMRKCETGTNALRAGVPAAWIAADKTGSGDNATRNDLALFRRPGRAPVVVAAYLTGAHAVDRDGRDRALAGVGRVVAEAFA